MKVSFDADLWRMQSYMLYIKQEIHDSCSVCCKAAGLNVVSTCALNEKYTSIVMFVLRLQVSVHVVN